MFSFPNPGALMQLDQFRLVLGGKTMIPLIVGGMGVNVSTSLLAREAARLGGIGHISDAMIPAVCDKLFGTKFVRNKRARNPEAAPSADKPDIHFDLDQLEKAQRMHVEDTMSGKQGSGQIFINVMEKLTMNRPVETLRARLRAALDGGIEGITLSAGLHLRSLSLIEDHPRFRDVNLGIVVSSAKALKVFLTRAAKMLRLPDYVVVEGPLAGGHLGFSVDNWREFDLKQIVQSVLSFLKKEELDIPVISAGGVFTGGDAVECIHQGASAVQVATRFAIAQESGFPDEVKQAYLKAGPEDVEVNSVSPTGYAMRMLKQTPAMQKNSAPNCESFGYLLNKGRCPYLNAWHNGMEKSRQRPERAGGPVCLCSEMLRYRCWTCGHNVYRLKETTNLLDNGAYQLPTAEDVFNDYRFSRGDEIRKPALINAKADSTA